MPKKIYPPSEAMQKKKAFKSLLQQVDRQSNITKDALRPIIQWREDFIDEIKSKSMINNSKDYLTIDIDKYGLFIIDGNTIDIAHSTNSTYGALLTILFNHRREPIARKDLQNQLGNPELNDTLRELKKQLRKIGFEPDIKSNKIAHSVTFNGICYKD